MYYTQELDFLIRLMEKSNIKTAIVDLDAPPYALDFGIRSLLGLQEDHSSFFYGNFRTAAGGTVYRLSDGFFCNYIFMMLPKSVNSPVLLIGPYMTLEPTADELAETAERCSLPASRLNQLRKCFSYINCVHDTASILNAVTTFAETLWGTNAFEIADITVNAPENPKVLPSFDPTDDEDSIFMKMELMERRYHFENQLMDNISQGRQHRAELMLSNFSSLVFEQRSQDPLRNMKNYCIICNTLMRKAAQWGGVHPLYLDTLSSDIAKRIESLLNTNAAYDLIIEMSRSYCRLVRKHAGKHYSPPVQKAIAFIDANLSSNIGLSRLAEVLDLSPGYLSTLFKAETDTTVTEYINAKRMELATRLLTSTRLQVQTIAQHCGMLDVNYFSKLFKKYHLLTPKQFREKSFKREKTE